MKITSIPLSRITKEPIEGIAVIGLSLGIIIYLLINQGLGAVILNMGGFVTYFLAAFVLFDALDWLLVERCRFHFQWYLSLILSTGFYLYAIYFGPGTQFAWDHLVIVLYSTGSISGVIFTLAWLQRKSKT